MWIAIVYVCAVTGCFFADAPPTYTKDGCLENAQAAHAALLADDKVLMFDVTCIHVKMTES